MQDRVLIYLPRFSSPMGTSAETLDSIRRTVEDRGSLVVEVVAGTRPNHNAGLRTLAAHLGVVDQMAVMSAADLPALR